MRLRWPDLGLPCKILCGKDLHRPHIGCVTCRLRRRAYGKPFPKPGLMVYRLYIHRYRRFARVKNKLIHVLMSIAEVLAN